VCKGTSSSIELAIPLGRFRARNRIKRRYSPCPDAARDPICTFFPYQRSRRKGAVFATFLVATLSANLQLHLVYPHSFHSCFNGAPGDRGPGLRFPFPLLSILRLPHSTQTRDIPLSLPPLQVFFRSAGSSYPIPTSSSRPRSHRASNASRGGTRGCLQEVSKEGTLRRARLKPRRKEEGRREGQPQLKEKVRHNLIIIFLLLRSETFEASGSYLLGST
jgi:hypothetical protein